MTQPAHRKRAARRAAQKAPRHVRAVIHVLTIGEARNPIGSRAPLDMAVFCYEHLPRGFA